MHDFKNIAEKLRGTGGRITRQRKMVIKVILSNPGVTCKELCYLSKKVDSSINDATVYRTVRLLEEIGVTSRRGISVC